MTAFPALPGFYNILFLHLEPVSTISPAILAWFFPGAAWFYHELIPSAASTPAPEAGTLEARASMAIWQLTNCYLLLGLISSLVFRAVRDALPNDPVAQERIIGASLTALAIADVSISSHFQTSTLISPPCFFNSIIATLIGLPPAIRYNPLTWNSMTHGNISIVVVLFSVRLAWFLGVGRKTYYYGQPSPRTVKKEN
ncbi:hypothetical protein DFH11DRAFT_1685926 [Phellopilus nigrolimitatus]|nr:hypothetical protein DFH11DRAFT_1685926 [Phellopilus nigrolimitatus]